jgi:DNA polymerase-3 subunit delta
VSERRLHLVVGDDEFLAERAVAGVVETARAEDPGALFEAYAAGDMSPGDLMAAVSPSLFGGERVVVIRDGQDAKKDLTSAILDYITAPEPDVTLVVTHAGGAKGKALADGLRSAGATAVTVPTPRYEQRHAFVRDEIRRHGAKCSDAAVNALVEAVGSSTRELAAACQQLVADTGGQIELSHVTRYYRGKAEVNGYTISDAVMAGDLPAALDALRWALNIGVDPVPIADALAVGVRTLSRVAAAGRADPKQLASQLGMHWFTIKKAQGWASGWSPDALARAMSVVGSCNVDVRGGVEDRAYALESTVMTLIALRGPSAVARGRRGSG